MQGFYPRRKQQHRRADGDFSHCFIFFTWSVCVGVNLSIQQEITLSALVLKSKFSFGASNAPKK